ncbi:hypothetical protein ACHAWO_003776 [Cyclotella atomus]|uniref:Uncharacterized protein n=1 Tax=Cyclotella atomus TaxID=382360 RepID=A0ABD3NCF2_9STRA
MRLSIPPVYTTCPSLAYATAVIWYSSSNLPTSPRTRTSQSLDVRSSLALTARAGDLQIKHISWSQKLTDYSPH